MLADSFDDKVRSTNPVLAVGKRMVKGCTDKVNLALVGKNHFSGKLPYSLLFTDSVQINILIL